MFLLFVDVFLLVADLDVCKKKGEVALANFASQGKLIRFTIAQRIPTIMTRYAASSPRRIVQLRELLQFEAFACRTAIWR